MPAGQLREKDLFLQYHDLDRYDHQQWLELRRRWGHLRHPPQQELCKIL